MLHNLVMNYDIQKKKGILKITLEQFTPQGNLSITGIDIPLSELKKALDKIKDKN